MTVTRHVEYENSCRVEYIESFYVNQNESIFIKQFKTVCPLKAVNSLNLLLLPINPFSKTFLPCLRLNHFLRPLLEPLSFFIVTFTTAYVAVFRTNLVVIGISFDFFICHLKTFEFFPERVRDRIKYNMRRLALITSLTFLAGCRASYSVSASSNGNKSASVST